MARWRINFKNKFYNETGVELSPKIKGKKYIYKF